MFSMWSYGGHHRLKSPADLRVAAPSKISNLYHGWLHYAPPSPSLAIKAWKRPRRSSQPPVHVQVQCRSLYAKAQGHSSVKSTSRYLLWDCKRCPCLRWPYCVCLLLFDSSLNAAQVKRELVWIVVHFPLQESQANKTVSECTASNQPQKRCLGIFSPVFERSFLDSLLDLLGTRLRSF